MSNNAPEMPDLAPHLKPSQRNIDSALKALARIREQAWEPLSAYPGSDVLWDVRCLLCNWEGQRFYSHLRRGIPISRHPGCLPKGQHAAAIAAVIKARGL